MMQKISKFIIPVICLVMFTLLSSTTVADNESSLTTIPGMLSDFIPISNTTYKLVTPPFLHKTTDSDYQDNKATIACSLANELIFRTSLRNVYLISSAVVIPKENDFIVRFESVAGKETLLVKVDVNKQHLSIENQT